ncbi:MAG: AAA family ATPase [Calditrichaeota bacterium]|nr:AAA family ATPase [Calditrichota bacterium]
MYKRKQFDILLQRINDKRRFIQVLTGPRQTGKTTLARQILNHKWPNYYASADDPAMKDKTWIEQHWENARLKVIEKEEHCLECLPLQTNFRFRKNFL